MAKMNGQKQEQPKEQEQTKEQALDSFVTEHRTVIGRIKELRKSIKAEKETQKKVESALYPLAIELKRYDLFKIKTGKTEAEEDD